MKKLLTLALILVGVPTTVGAFTDVDKSYRSRAAIDYVYENGIVSGYSDNTFRPEQEINRAEFLKMLVEYQYEEEDFAPFANENCFTDVPAGQWYTPYVCFGKRNYIIAGYEGNTFKPSANINLVEAAKIIAIVLGDVEDPQPGTVWYRPYIEYLSDKQAITQSVVGFTSNINRAEMAEMLYRIGLPQDRPHKAYVNGALVPVGEDDTVDLDTSGDFSSSVLEMSVAIKDFALEPSTIVLTPNKKVDLHIRALDRDYTLESPVLGIEGTIKKGTDMVFAINPERLGTFYLYCQEDCGDHHGSIKGKFIVK